MKSINLSNDKKIEAFGLSCVENLILYIMNDNNVSFQNCFCDSFLTYNEIEKFFLTEKCSYATFNGVQRLQQVAKRENILDLIFHEIKFISNDSSIITDSERYWLIMVRPDFVDAKYHKRLWRDDHYILLSSRNTNHLEYINDYPFDIGTLTFDELNSYFGGFALEVEIRNQSFPRTQRSYIYDLLIKVHADRNDNLTTLLNTEMFRDIIGILRILRKRMYALLSLEYDVQFMLPYLKNFDRNYALLEYMRLKNQVEKKKINELRQNVINDDNELLLQIMNLKNEIRFFDSK